MPLAAASDQPDSLQPFLELLAEDTAAGGIVLMGLNADATMLAVTESHPAGLAGQGFPMAAHFPEMADRGMIASGDVRLPTILTRWLGAQPQHLCLHTLQLPEFSGYLLFCWQAQRPSEAVLARCIKAAARILPTLIDRHRLLTENEQLTGRLKRLNAELLAREAELKRYAEDLETSRASIEQQAKRAIDLAEELHLQKQELESSKRESDYLANHDPLTGLNNRRAFRHALQQMIDVARGTQGQVAVLFIDLDKFKAVNDTLGHDAGDHLLKEVAKILNDALRDTDLLARFGGDEFAIATRIPGSADLAKVTGLAERIRQKLEIPVPAATAETPDNIIQVCATIGIGLYPGDAADIDTLFICADRAMYKGKKAGRNRVVMFRDVFPTV